MFNINYKILVLKTTFLCCVAFYLSMLLVNKLLPLGIPVGIDLKVVDIEDVQYTDLSDYNIDAPVDVIYKDSWDRYKYITYSSFSNTKNIKKGRSCLLTVEFKNLFSGTNEERLLWIFEDF